MTSAYACPVRSFDAMDLSILRQLYLWVASSMELDGLQLPSVSINPSPTGVFRPCTVSDFAFNEEWSRLAEALANLS